MMTPQDLARVLSDLQTRRAQPLNRDHHSPIHRAPVFGAVWQGETIAIKLTAQQTALDHVANTELFHFFDMPYVPCQAVAIPSDIDMQDFFVATLGTKRNYLTYAVVMPQAPGVNGAALAHGTTDPQNIGTFYTNILSHATEICLTHAWDCKPKNVIVQSDVEKSIFGKKRYVLDPSHYAFIDAEYGLLTKEYIKPDQLDVYACFAMMSESYLQKMPVTAQYKNNLMAMMLHKCDSWRDKIENAFTVTPPAHRPQLQDILINRTQTVKDHLTTKGLSL